MAKSFKSYKICFILAKTKWKDMCLVQIDKDCTWDMLLKKNNKRQGQGGVMQPGMKWSYYSWLFSNTSMSQSILFLLYNSNLPTSPLSWRRRCVGKLFQRLSETLFFQHYFISFLIWNVECPQCKSLCKLLVWEIEHIWTCILIWTLLQPDLLS